MLEACHDFGGDVLVKICSSEGFPYWFMGEQI
jgi:hypothetical protein